MATFTLRARTTLPPERALAALLDLEGHDAFIPATRVEALDEPPLRTGSRFVGVTTLPGVRVVDEMVIGRLRSGAEDSQCEIDKVGRPVLGGTAITVTRRAGGSTVTWRQRLGLSFLPRALDPLLRPAGWLAYRLVVHRLLRRGEAAWGRERGAV